MGGKKSRSKRLQKFAQPPITPPESSSNDPLQKKIGDETSEENLKVYLPGMALEEGEELQVDPSAYIMLHEMHSEWPCLSFDIIQDAGPQERSQFPMSGYLVTGTQADRSQNNQLCLLRMTNLRKTHVAADEDESEPEDEDDDADNEDESEESAKKKAPVHHAITFAHDGGVNRIRSNRAAIGNNSHIPLIVASWSEKGHVNVFDLSQPFADLASIADDAPASLQRRGNSLKPIHKISSHHNEGFALAWSPLNPAWLLSGDCDGSIHFTDLSTLQQAPQQQNSLPFSASKSSVEDLQWSPSEPTVFCSSSVDGFIRLWDVRLPRDKAALSCHAHPTDVNVISWNNLSNHMLASGADDGCFSVWDLRCFRPESESVRPVPLFSEPSWHRGPITSIEWSPHDASILAISGADDQLTLWDLSVEANAEDGVMELEGRKLPPSLLFIHQGQSEIKELHWHSQLSGVLVSTSLSGFNIFKTISI